MGSEMCIRDRNRRTKAVPTKAMVGEITIKLKPIAALISLIVKLL